MATKSAGILLYRLVRGLPQVLLVHPGGPLWTNRDIGAWQMPKGMIEEGEDGEAAARREVAEELGIAVEGQLTPLGEIRQAAGKIVVAFAARQDFDPATLTSNMVEIDWPPRSGRKRMVPEVDEARWFDLEDARAHMLSSQVPLLDRLTTVLADTARSPADIRDQGRES